MALPGYVHDDARRSAHTHLQVEVLAVAFEREHLSCRMQVRVLHAWPQNGFAPPSTGSEFALTTACVFADQTRDLPCGGTIYLCGEGLESGVVLEGFFSNGTVTQGQISRVAHAPARTLADSPAAPCATTASSAPPAPKPIKRAPKNWVERWFGVWE